MIQAAFTNSYHTFSSEWTPTPTATCHCAPCNTPNVTTLDITYLVLTPSHCKCKPSLDATTFPNSRHVSLPLRDARFLTRCQLRQAIMTQTCKFEWLICYTYHSQQHDASFPDRQLTVTCLLHTRRHSNCLSYVTRPHVETIRPELPWYTAAVPLNCDDKTSNLSCTQAH